jgi:hypothetical protein
MIKKILIDNLTVANAYKCIDDFPKCTVAALGFIEHMTTGTYVIAPVVQGAILYRTELSPLLVKLAEENAGNPVFDLSVGVASVAAATGACVMLGIDIESLSNKIPENDDPVMHNLNIMAENVFLKEEEIETVNNFEKIPKEHFDLTDKENKNKFDYSDKKIRDELAVKKLKDLLMITKQQERFIQNRGFIEFNNISDSDSEIIKK